MLDFLVLYSSNTGNTRMVATSIFNAIPGTSKELCDIKDFHYDKEANLYFIGFWTNRGSCDISIINLLASLHGKKIALFGTCGIGNSSAYFHAIAGNVAAFIPEDCDYLGSFLCQGRMSEQILARYESMQRKNPADSSPIERMIQNFNEASLHPDEDDLVNAQNFAGDILLRCKP